MIRREIEALNRDIDLRIIKGLPYAREARRHTFLRNQLKRLAPRRESWLFRSFKLAGSFMF